MTDRDMKPQSHKRWQTMAHTITQALPYLRRFTGQTFVIKYGGHLMGDDSLAADFARDIVLLKQVGINPVVVHGGGPQIGAMLKRLNIHSDFIDGLRVTGQSTVEIVEMVLSGSINKGIVANINEHGGTAIGISGKDGNLLTARKLRRTKRDPDSNIERAVDLGFVGEPKAINADLLAFLIESDIIPVIAPLGVGDDGHTYNINADTMAGAIAGAMNAEKLIMLTDVEGVLDKDNNLIPSLNPSGLKRLMQDGTISGGMIPKIETCTNAVKAGATSATILDGRVPHAVLLEIFTPQGVGTMIYADGELDRG